MLVTLDEQSGVIPSSTIEFNRIASALRFTQGTPVGSELTQDLLELLGKSVPLSKIQPVAPPEAEGAPQEGVPEGGAPLPF
jgi:hypothetical protein